MANIDSWGYFLLTLYPAIALTLASTGLVLAFRRSTAKFSIGILWQAFLFILALAGLLTALFVVMAGANADAKQLEAMESGSGAFFLGLTALSLALPVALWLQKALVKGLQRAKSALRSKPH